MFSFSESMDQIFNDFFSSLQLLEIAAALKNVIPYFTGPELRLNMCSVFVNGRNFCERTEFLRTDGIFVNFGIVQLKKTMDEQLVSFSEIK